jgi:hypothetical protein
MPAGNPKMNLRILKKTDGFYYPQKQDVLFWYDITLPDWGGAVHFASYETAVDFCSRFEQGLVTTGPKRDVVVWTNNDSTKQRYRS